MNWMPVSILASIVVSGGPLMMGEVAVRAAPGGQHTEHRHRRDVLQLQRDERSTFGDHYRGIRHVGTWSIALALAWLPSCAATPPDSLSDAAEAEIYGRILPTARRELGIPAAVPVHPFLAILQDSAGYPVIRLTEFEYEPSAALRSLAASDSSVVLCEYDLRGTCVTASYLVLSQIRRLAERDAAVVVFAADAQSTRHLLVRLRYHRNSWTVTRVEQ